MEVRAVLPLPAALGVHLLAHIVEGGEVLAAVLGQLPPRHLLRRPAAPDQHAGHAESHDAPNRPYVAKLRIPDTYIATMNPTTPTISAMGNTMPQTALRRDRGVDRRVHRDLAARGSGRLLGGPGGVKGCVVTGPP